MAVRGKFGDTEDIKIEVTMFDGYETVPRTGDDSSGEDVHNLSMLVDISEGDGSNDREFLCSAWPDRLEVQKVYVLHCDRMPAKPYMGPDFGSLKKTIQKRFIDYLEARVVNDEISNFLASRYDEQEWNGIVTFHLSSDVCDQNCKSIHIYTSLKLVTQ